MAWLPDCSIFLTAVSLPPGSTCRASPCPSRGYATASAQRPERVRASPPCTSPPAGRGPTPRGGRRHATRGCGCPPAAGADSRRTASSSSSQRAFGAPDYPPARVPDKAGGCRNGAIRAQIAPCIAIFLEGTDGGYGREDARKHLVSRGFVNAIRERGHLARIALLRTIVRRPRSRRSQRPSPGPGHARFESPFMDIFNTPTACIGELFRVRKAGYSPSDAFPSSESHATTADAT